MTFLLHLIFDKDRLSFSGATADIMAITIRRREQASSNRSIACEKKIHKLGELI